MQTRLYTPHAALQEYVLNIATVFAELPEGMHSVVTPYPPTPLQSLMFYCNDPVSMGRGGEGTNGTIGSNHSTDTNSTTKTNNSFDLQPLSVLVGPQLSRVNIKVVKRLRAVRVDFLPGAMFRLLGFPMHEMMDGGFDASDVFGPEMKVVNEKLQNITSLEEGKDVVEQFLLGKVRRFSDRLPIDAALHQLMKHDGNLPVERIASLACLSLKQFERRCRERLGMNPKIYARILKFSKAYRLHEASPQLSWIKIAYEAGYYDQMHMIRDFRVFAGVNPTVITQQLSATPIRMQRDLPL